jgi:CO dehydrogenase nickel-insertion accessory protein CooC1
MDNTNGGNDGCAIHMSLQGKGGVGKSLASSVLAQYFMARGRAVRCIDADPVNKTLFQYRALEAKPLQLLHDGAIDSRHDAAGYSQQPFWLSIGTGLEQTQ